MYLIINLKKEVVTYICLMFQPSFCGNSLAEILCTCFCLLSPFSNAVTLKHNSFN